MAVVDAAGGPRFFADDIAAPAVALWAARAQVTPVRAELARDDVLLVNALDDSTFGRRLRVGGPTLCAARIPANRIGRLLALHRREKTLLAFCADTRSAIELDAPRALRQALVDAGWIAGTVADDFETCAQEAVSNALIHGNLGLSAQPRNSLDAYLRFAQLIDERLADDRLGLRAIYARVCAAGDSLILSIGDEGLGMPDGPPKHGLAVGTAVSGRGLALIRTLGVDVRHRQGGRICVMRLRRCGER